MKKANGKLQKMTVRQLLDEWWKRLNDNSQGDKAAQEVNEEIKRRDAEEILMRATMEQKGSLKKNVAERKYVEYFKGKLWKRKKRK